VAGGGTDVALDEQGDLWVANGTGVSEFNDLGVTLSPAGGYGSAFSGITAVAVDSSNNVWLGINHINAIVSQNFAELGNPGGQVIVTGAGEYNGVFPQMASDGAGKLWAVTTDNHICTFPPYAGGNFSGTVSCTFGDPLSGWPFYDPRGVAVDGAGVVWVASAGGLSASNRAIPPSVLPIVIGGTGSYNPQGYYVSPSLGAGPLRVAMDGSGNLWVLLADNTVTEYVGAAAPVVTPLSLAIQNKKLGAKP
jgi:hypothetical protein